MGHLRSYCPKVAAGNTKAWYPPLNDTTDTCVVGGCLNEMSLGFESDCGYDCEDGGDFVDSGEELESSGYFLEAGKEAAFVKGKLREHLHFWREELKAPDSILNVIESGYVLPLKSPPPPHVQRNHSSAILYMLILCVIVLPSWQHQGVLELWKSFHKFVVHCLLCRMPQVKRGW